MNEILDVSFEDFIKRMPASDVFKENLFVQKFNRPQMRRQLISPIRFDAVSLFFCKNGEMSLSIDYQEHLLKKNTLSCVTNLHIIDKIVVSENIEGYAIIMSVQFAKSVIDGIPISNNIITEGARPRPVTELDEAEMQCLSNIIERIINIQGDVSHAFQSYIVKNEVSNLVLEILNINIKKNKNQTAPDKSEHKKEVVRKFILLLIQNCKEHHEVSFYAAQMCMTAGNLSRIMKANSGKTAIEWISDALVIEAKILLSKPDTAIQYVADELHFADQSSFGKFFRKHTGLTPSEYKKCVQK